MIDVPNERSSHDLPTPRGGGLGVLLGLLAGVGLSALFAGPTLDPALVGALLIVAAAGLIDDVLNGVSRLGRLAAQIAAAGLVVWRLGPLESLPLPAPADVDLAGLGYPLSILWIVGLINLTNFLDGIDGFAASQGLLAGLGLAIAGLARESPSLLLLGAILAASCLGFLPSNWQPARVFLGDVGSASLGFVLAIAPWTVSHSERGETLFLVAMLTWFFLADGTWTLLTRAARGERVWQAHRQHLYQRLVRSGLDHARTCRRILSLALAPALLGVAGYALSNPTLEWAALGVGVLAFALLSRQVVVRERVA